MAEGSEHFCRQFGLGLETNFSRQIALCSSLNIVVPEPLLRDEQSLVDQGISVFRHIPGKDSYLAIVDFSDCPTVLASDTD